MSAEICSQHSRREEPRIQKKQRADGIGRAAHGKREEEKDCALQKREEQSAKQKSFFMAARRQSAAAKGKQIGTQHAAHGDEA